MAITLRNEKGSPLTNTEVDDNFITLRDEKISRDGTIAMTGKLTAVQANTSRASIRIPKNDTQEPSAPVEGDLWNLAGVLKFRKDGSTTTTLITADDTASVTNTMLENSSITVSAGTGITVSGSPVALGGTVTVSIPQAVATTSNVQFQQIGVGLAPSGWANGEIRATNEITAFSTSDASLKENVAPIQDALAKLSQIRGVTFDWTDAHLESRGGEDGVFVRKHDIGVIAQEVQAVLPEVVVTRENGTLAVRYEKLVPLLIQAINELNEKVSKCKCGRG